MAIGLYITIQSIRLLHEHWVDLWLIQRNRSLILVLFACNTIHVVFVFPHIVLCNILYGDWPLHHLRIHTFVACITINGICVFYFGRIFLLYFNHQYHNAIVSKGWNLLINAELFRSNWFILNQHKYKNPKFVTKLFLGLWITMCIVVLGIDFVVHYFTGQGVHQLISTAAIFIGCYYGHKWWRTFPVIRDNWHIRAEMIFVIKSLCILAPLFFGFTIVFQLSKKRGIREHPELYLLDNVYFTGVLLFQYGLVLYPHKLVRNAKESDQKTNGSRRRRNSSITLDKWSDIIGDRQGLESFMQFLQTEVQYLSITLRNLLCTPFYLLLLTVFDGKSVVHHRVPAICTITVLNDSFQIYRGR